MPEEIKKDEPKKKGPLGKLKEKIDDADEQMAILSTFVRLGILVWSGGILTLAYIKLPPALGIPEQKLDPTFIASVFTGVLAHSVFRLQRKVLMVMSLLVVESVKLDLERLIEKASQTAPAQTIRIEQAPITIGRGNDEPPVKPTV